MSKFKQIGVDLISANRNRNFKLYPIVKSQVKALAESYDETGDFGVIPVRELEDGSYEMAAGHHRLEALKTLGFTHADCKVDEYDEDEMIRIMVNENSRQMGNNAPAALDSLSAVTYQVAYYLLICDTVEEFENLLSGAPEKELNSSGFKKAKTVISQGEPVGFAFLKAYAHDGISGKSQVAELNSTLRDSGELGRIYKRVVKRVDEELAEAAAEEAEAEAARLEAEALAEKQRLAYEKARKAAAKAAKEAKASEKVAAEANAKRQAKIAKEKAKLRDEEAKQREIARKKADADREERQRRQREAKASAKAAAEAAKGLNPAVLHMLKAQGHQAAFRKIVTSEEGEKVFPIAMQPEVVTAMLAYLGDDISTPAIQEYLREKMRSASAILRDIIRDQQEKEVKRSVVRKVHTVLDEFRVNTTKTAASFRKMGALLDDEATQTYTLGELATDQNLSNMIDDLEQMIVTIRANVKLKQSIYQSTTIDHNEDRGRIVESI